MMRRLTVSSLVAAVASAAFALNPGTELVVPAAARGGGAGGSFWVTDLYLYNPGTGSVDADLYWLPRDTDNSGATPVRYTVPPGESVALPDAIQNVFGLASGAGAIRIVATGGELVASSRILNTADPSGTYGQGFEAVPTSAALAPGGVTDVVGLAQGGGFRSNLFAVNVGSTPAAFTLSVRTAGGAEVAATSVSLPPYAAWYRSLPALGVATLQDGTAHVEVTSGAVVVVGSRIDDGSGDPTTLEAWWRLGTAGGDGTYYLAIYDSLGYATGGAIVLSGGVTSLDATYTNWDKVDGSGTPECTWIFAMVASFDPPLTLDELAAGVTFSNDYADLGGTMEWTVRGTLTDGLLAGSVDAVGSGFSGDAAGCNGAFPTLTLLGGHGP